MSEENTAPNWFIDEGIAGVGDRPQWLPDKFKTAADLGKSYAELEKKISAVPEEYNIQSKFLDKDYQPIQEFLSLAKEKRVPKEVVDKMVDSFDKYIDQYNVNPEEEIKKLGTDGQERMKILDNWAKANLSESAYKALTNDVKSADAIKALEELRGKMMSNAPVIPNGNDSSTNNVQTVADLQEELQTNHAKFKTDPKYRADWQGRLALASKNSGFIDKMGA